MEMESQNVEYKQSWKDDYLKWICGFANAQGGTIYIGIGDNGIVTGVENAKFLLEYLPNKVIQSVGVVPSILFGWLYRKLGTWIRDNTRILCQRALTNTSFRTNQRRSDGHYTKREIRVTKPQKWW